MQIFTAEQIRAWDEYTIRHEPIASVDLMERAAQACCNWLWENGYKNRSFSVFCGKGNNGGDGLAIARLFARNDQPVSVYILEFGHKGTGDFQMNLSRLHETDVAIKFISSEDLIQRPAPGDIIIDALLGSGLNRPLEGLTAKLVELINKWGNETIAVDIPSGMFVDSSSKGNTIIKAAHTLSFQAYKMAFLAPENQDYVGEVHILDIGLHPDYLKTNSSNQLLTDLPFIQSIIKPRKKFSHKGDFGHAALVAGSAGMMGAAMLSGNACMRSGVGKLTCHVPATGNDIIQLGVPEALCKVEKGTDHVTEFTVDSKFKYSAIGIGPGIGTYDSHAALLQQVFSLKDLPMVIDADALNTISIHKLQAKIPAGSILTPHPGEFERLFGPSKNDFERITKAQEQAMALNVCVLLKGHYTLVATPAGRMYYNTTGNPGMATAGSGDVLTGIIIGLLAQKYAAWEAAVLGVYLHGLAGDIAAAYTSQESLIATDIINYLADAWRQLYESNSRTL